jgi:hypothetical protein
MIAALFVQKGGAYYGIPDVDPWPVARDARRYAGPFAVVAHPPCARWSRLAGLVESRARPSLTFPFGGTDRRRREDGGCFASALASVRRWGGVLEHPRWSEAWATFGLPVPPAAGGWVRGACGGWCCQVEQGWYGHLAPKATWLYAVGVERLPDLCWGPSPAMMVVTKSRGRRDKPEMPKSLRSATPPAFRDLLLNIARSARPASEAA